MDVGISWCFATKINKNGHLDVLKPQLWGFRGPRLARFRGIQDTLALKDLLAELDLTILGLGAREGARDGPQGPQGLVLTELATQLHQLAESAQQTEAEAAQAAQQRLSAELRQEELEMQKLRLEAELAKTQMMQSTLQDRGGVS